MKVFIDANLLIYLNALRTRSKRLIYENFYLDLLSKYKAYTDALVLDEVIYVSHKRYQVPYKISIEFIDSTVLPFVEILPLGEEEYMKATKLIDTNRVKPSDALHAAAMIIQGISRVASEDKEFDKIKGITRIWLD